MQPALPTATLCTVIRNGDSGFAAQGIAKQLSAASGDLVLVQGGGGDRRFQITARITFGGYVNGRQALFFSVSRGESASLSGKLRGSKG